MKIREIEKRLDSDDEFPDDYNEPYKDPVYINDNRFDSIEFKWIEKLDKEEKPKEKLDKDDTSNKEEKPMIFFKENEFMPNSLIINRGVMNKQDLFCLKTIAKSCPNRIFIWFTNFTVYKDLQSPYNFLQSCLVTR